MAMNIGRYIEPKARYIVRMHTKDGNRLKNKLLETLIQDTVEYYHLDSVQEAKARRIVKMVKLNNIGGVDIKPEVKNLPNNWKDIINVNRKSLFSYKQLTREEIQLHKHYCTKDKCAFVDNKLCPVVRFSKEGT